MSLPAFVRISAPIPERGFVTASRLIYPSRLSSLLFIFSSFPTRLSFRGFPSLSLSGNANIWLSCTLPLTMPPSAFYSLIVSFTHAILIISTCAPKQWFRRECPPFVFLFHHVDDVRAYHDEKVQDKCFAKSIFNHYVSLSKDLHL